MLSEQEIKELAPQIPSWMIHEEEGIKRLICSFAFSSYEDSVNFTNKVGELADIEGHHPDISLGWGYSLIMLHTHAIKGLSINDFILAAKIDIID